MNTNDIIAKWQGSVFFLLKFFSNLRINCYCPAYLNLRCKDVHLNLPLTFLSTVNLVLVRTVKNNYFSMCTN